MIKVNIYNQSGKTLLYSKSVPEFDAITLVDSGTAERYIIKFWKDNIHLENQYDIDMNLASYITKAVAFGGLATAPMSHIADYERKAGAVAKQYPIYPDNNTEINWFLAFYDNVGYSDATTFKILLYHNASPEYILNKALSGETERVGTLKRDTSIINPVIEIVYGYGSTFDFNYVYISQFHRYYFIEDVVYTNANHIELHMRVDALMSFRSVINASSIYAIRSEKYQNTEIYDSAIPLKNKPTITRKIGTIYRELFNRDATGYCCVVNIIGHTPNATSSTGLMNYTGGSCTGNLYYLMTTSQLRALMMSLEGKSASVQNRFKWARILPVLGIDNNCTLVANKPYYYDGKTAVKLIDQNVNEIKGYSITKQLYYSFDVAKTGLFSGIGANDRLSTYTLNLPFVPPTQIYYRDFVSMDYIKIYAAIDILSGSLKYYIYGVTSDGAMCLTQTLTAQIGNLITFNASNAANVEQSRINANVATAIGGGIGIVAGVASQNYAAAALAGANTIAGIANNINQYDNMIVQPASAQAQGALANVFDDFSVSIIRKTNQLYVPNTTYNRIHGRLTEQAYPSVSGRAGMLWGDILLSTNGNIGQNKWITEPERTTIRQLFKGGVDVT